MVLNYLFASFRILKKEKLYTIINAAGLAVALAACLIIYAWVQFETSYDKYLEGHERVYRIPTLTENSAEPGIASTYPMVRTRILSQFPEVESSTRIFDEGFLGTKTKISHVDKVFTDSKFFYADSTFFAVFPLPFIEGDASTALRRPNAVILTEETAARYFGDEDPVGKQLTIGDRKDFEVTAVIRNIPAASHFHFDILASMEAHPWIKGAEKNVWSGVVFHTYVKLKPGALPADLEAKIDQVLRNFPDNPTFASQVKLPLQPVDDIHLKSELQYEFESTGSLTYVYLFSTIALLVLVVAMINYTNLAMARHTQRFREVAVRKILGATRKQLITQFIIESLIITILSFLIAFVFARLFEPYMTAFSDQQGLSTLLLKPVVLTGILVVTLLIGLTTGLTPALALSVIKPVVLLKGNPASGSRRFPVRKVLIVSQFTVSIALTICTAITYRQVRYLESAKLGYDMHRVLVLHIGYPELRSKYALLKSQVAAHASVLGVAATSQLPTDIQTGENIDISASKQLGVYCVSVDEDFFRVMDIPFREGGEQVPTIQPNDSINRFVLTEGARKAIGWSEREAQGKEISIRHGNQHPGPVLGVTSDFHFQSLRHPVQPLVFEFNPDDYEYLLVRLNSDQAETTIAAIGKIWSGLSGGIPFDYQFLDQSYNNLYKGEQRSSSLFITFAAVALFISLLGLFGLSSFAIERRTREIGLRKILGARTGQILMLVSRDFLILLGMAFFLAIPLGYYFMQAWLSGFAYQATMGPGLFILAGLANVVLALIVLSYHSLRIAENDPVRTLRYE